MCLTLMNPSFRPIVLRLAMAQITLHAAMAGVRMAAPLLALRSDHSAFSVGVLLALFAVAQVFLALPVGRLTDRHGLRKPVALAVTSAFVGIALAGFYPTFGMLCFTAVLSGAASGTVMIAVQRHAGRLSHDANEIKQVFSWMAVGPTLANFIGPLSTGLLIDAIDFGPTFWVLSVLPLLAWVAVRPLAELIHEPHAQTEPESAQHKGSSWNLLRIAPLRQLLTVNWLLASCWDVHAFMVPLLGHDLGLSASAIGSILGAFALAGTAMRLALPWMVHRLPEMQVVGTAMLLTAVWFALYPFAEQAWQMALLSALLGTTLGSVQPLIMSTLHQVTPRHRQGEALGLRMMTIYASSVVMPMVYGSAGTLLGVGVVFWAMGSVVGAGSRLAFTLERVRHLKA